MTDSDEERAEELLGGSKKQTRYNDVDDGEQSLNEIIKEYHRAFEANDVSENLSFRDGQLAALLRALEDQGELEEITRAAESKLGREETRKTGRAETLRLLLRIALREVAPDAVEVANEARKEYIFEKDSEL